MKLKEIKQMYKQTEDTDGSKGPMVLSDSIVFGYDEFDHVLNTQETREITEGIVGDLGISDDQL